MSIPFPPTLFIAGNRSGTGKTTICVALMRRAIELGGHPSAIKPIDANCRYGEDHDLVSDDGLRLAKARGRPIPPLVTVPYRFAQQKTPLAAARKSGLSLRLDHLEQAIRVAGEHGDVLFVELPGPADMPIAEDGIGPDLAARMSAPLLLLHARGSQIVPTPFAVRTIIVNDGTAGDEPDSQDHSPPPRDLFATPCTFPPFPNIPANIDEAALEYVREHRLLEQLFAPPHGKMDHA